MAISCACFVPSRVLPAAALGGSLAASGPRRRQGLARRWRGCGGRCWARWRPRCRGPQGGVGRDQRDAVVVARLPPDRIAAVRLDLRDKALASSAPTTFCAAPPFRRAEAAGRCGSGAGRRREDHELDVVELGHGAVLLREGPGPSRAFYHPRPRDRTSRGGSAFIRVRWQPDA